ncbi:MAG TPA: branched-chain amino acid ABC transporter permease, partial [Ilumatobacteraceae bacterium]|nr:branched-chain amino acid ABC transporter permease [Ilumatobacteraceae bacterium]
LSVTTLAFGMSVTSWLLNDRFFGWIPRQRLKVAPLFGRLDIDTPTRFYAFSVVVLAVVVLLVRGVRRSRVGRVIVAMRENERGVQAFSVSTVRAKLTAFMISGAIAGVAGALFVHMNHAFSLGQFNIGRSFTALTSAIIGGLGSITGVVIGATYIGVTSRLPDEWRILATSLSVLLILLVMPSGLGSQIVKVRDIIARAAQRRAGIEANGDPSVAAADAAEAAAAVRSAATNRATDGANLLDGTPAATMLEGAAE